LKRILNTFDRICITGVTMAGCGSVTSHYWFKEKKREKEREKQEREAKHESTCYFETHAVTLCDIFGPCLSTTTPEVTTRTFLCESSLLSASRLNVCAVACVSACSCVRVMCVDRHRSQEPLDLSLNLALHVCVLAHMLNAILAYGLCGFVSESAQAPFCEILFW